METKHPIRYWPVEPHPQIAGPPILVVFLLRNETGRADLVWFCEAVLDIVGINMAQTRKRKHLSREKIRACVSDNKAPGNPTFEKIREAAKSVHVVAIRKTTRIKAVCRGRIELV
jgi:hypothetical protein